MRSLDDELPGQLDPRLPHPTGGRDPGAPSLQDAAQASSVAIAVNYDGAVSIAASNCDISVKGVIPLDQFCERHIETIIADFVDQLTTAAVDTANRDMALTLL